MRDAVGQPAATTDLGAVDPIRIPGWARRWFRRTPTLARVFIALAIVDVVVRLLGIFEPFELRLDAPLVLIYTFVPRELWILLPALVTMRRPDAAQSIPWILRGSILLALLTLARDPLSALTVSYDFSIDGNAPGLLLAGATSILTITAWLMLGRGFERLRPRPATAVGGPLSTLVAVGFIAVGAVNAVALVGNPGIDLGPDYAALQLVANFLALLGFLATAYALWVVARGLGDKRRPLRATRLAVAAATAWASASVLAMLGSVWYLAVQPLPDFATDSPSIDLLIFVGWIAVAVAPTMLIAAMAIGYVDPDLPANESAPDESAPG